MVGLFFTQSRTMFFHNEICVAKVTIFDRDGRLFVVSTIQLVKLSLSVCVHSGSTAEKKRRAFNKSLVENVLKVH